MKITFLGGADEVGASSILIETGGRRVLVDAGIRPSPKSRWGLAGDQLPDLSGIDQAGGIDAVLVTHAHTDHTGALELVTNSYPQAPVYATPATIALARVLHLDSRRIMQSRLDEEGELPLFDDLAVEKLMSAFQPVPFQARLPLAEGLAATFFPAGHIAGAAMIGLESDEGRILISGDISISDQRTVSGARPPSFRPDLLILESTYGGRLHANRQVQERRLVETVAQVTGAGGKVLIPAFALGRAQEILLILGEFRRRGELPDVPVWADGMVRAICQAYSSFPEILPLPLQERGARFFDNSIRPVERSAQRNALVWQPEPAVIVASSGMLAGGPSLSYARALAGNPQHAILLTGYQDEESPGRRLQEVAERASSEGAARGSIRLGKDKVDVQCRLGTYSLSAHADEGQLISLVETLDPAEVLLVHGDESARSSLASALQERGRSVHLPHAGGSYTFRFTASPIHVQQARTGLGAGQPIDIRRLWSDLWSGLSASAGYFTLAELARLWWGASGADQAGELEKALAGDDLYFIRDDRRPDLYRLRPPRQVEIALERREKMTALAGASRRWVVWREKEAVRAARCLSIASEHLLVQLEDGEIQRVPPEAVVEVLGETPPNPQDLARYQAPPALTPVVMEPNQALAQANTSFPPEARLRKAGYRLEEHKLVLTFDFPDVAAQDYAKAIADLEAATGWQVEVTPSVNQAALNILVSEVLPPGWSIAKGPAIHRESRRVAVTLRRAGTPVPLPGGGNLPPELVEAARRYQETSGFELSLALAQSAGPAASPPAAPAAGGARWEINAAYAAIQTALEGTSLYRTSLKGDEIVLSFISPQVGSRSLAEIEALSRQTGWMLAINPQANQGAIAEKARLLLQEAGLAIQKGPGLHLERGEVEVALAGEPGEETRQEVIEAFERATGYRLALSWPASAAPAPAAQAGAKPTADIVEIPLERIRLRPYHQGLALNPEKVDKTIERARRMGGITPPVQLRRSGDGYVLVDGLYRLRAAQALGLSTIPAEIE